MGGRSTLTIRKQCMHIPAALYDSTSANTNLSCIVMKQFVFFPEKYVTWSDDYVEMYSVQLLLLVLLDNYVDVFNVKPT